MKMACILLVEVRGCAPAVVGGATVPQAEAVTRAVVGGGVLLDFCHIALV